MRAYSYRCHDFSLLTPGFKKWFVSPLLNYVPWVIPANIITIISNFFVYIGFFISLNYNTPLSRILIAVCFFLYLLGDHLDGMQAKRTKTGSALGEFCDHYLDAFNNGIILFTAFMVFGIYDSVIVAAVLTASYMAHMTVFYEQLKTGWLTFERLGSLEAVLLILFLVGFSAFDGIYQLFTTQFIFSYRLIDLMFMLSAMGATSTFIITLKRTPERGNEVWIFIIGAATVAVMGANMFGSLELFLLITLYASLYVGLIMKGHLVDGVERIPDLVIPLSLSLMSFLPLGDHQNLFWVLALYLLVRIFVLVFQTFNALKVYWVWSNPRI